MTLAEWSFAELNNWSTALCVKLRHRILSKLGENIL